MSKTKGVFQMVTGYSKSGKKYSGAHKVKVPIEYCKELYRILGVAAK